MTPRKRAIFLTLAFLIAFSLVIDFYFDTFSLKSRALEVIKILAATMDQERPGNMSSPQSFMNTTKLSNKRELKNGSKTWNEVKTILFYTAFFGRLPWPHTIGREKNLTDFSNRPCKVASCQFSISKNDISKSNVVIFHGYWTPSPADMRALMRKKPKNQMWAWFQEESQANTGIHDDKYNNIFELTITHRQESDIHTLYGEYFKLDDKARSQAEKTYANKNFAKGKDRLVLWFASNCVSLRLNIVKAIAKHIKVDVFGGCQRHFSSKPSGSCARRTPECQKINEKYKFFLSLENTNCRGYVTEKYWENALDRNVVPIVIAGSYNKDVLIPGSYIDILDFPNAQALTNHLKYLDKNETAYNSYFEWKKKYRYTRETNWICDLCEYLHRNETKKTFWDMKKFYGVKENCFADDSRIQSSWLKSWTVFDIFFYILIKLSSFF